jgi:hypothetical protein
MADSASFIAVLTLCDEPCELDDTRMVCSTVPATTRLYRPCRKKGLPDHRPAKGLHQNHVSLGRQIDHSHDSGNEKG